VFTVKLEQNFRCLRRLADRLLNLLPQTVLRPYEDARNNPRTAEEIFMKFDPGEFY
jgi:hypothetical protein